MQATVVRNIHCADRGAIETLGRLGVATVHEAQGRTGLMQPYMRPVWRGARVAGSAVTALCHPGDNWMIHVASEVLKDGDVIIADDDGVVVVPRLVAAKVANAGEAREKKEAGNCARLEKGDLGLDIYDMRKGLAEKGLKYVDGPIDY